MKVFDIVFNHEAVSLLGKDEALRIVFNLLRRLSIIFGGRCVHDAVCCYLAMNGYDVHKF